MRLKEETQNIWSKLGRDKVAKSHDIGIDEKSEHTDKSFSEASSVRLFINSFLVCLISWSLSLILAYFYAATQFLLVAVYAIKL